LGGACEDNDVRAVCDACQAFFITDAGSLGRWAAARPEYRPEQHAALAAAVADFKGLRRRDRAAFVAAVEQAMLAAQLEPAALGGPAAGLGA